MIIYQIHPKHGKLMPVTRMEADLNEKNGWKTVTEAEFYGDAYEEKKTEEQKETGEEMLVEHSDIPRSVLEELYEAKFGKKPHHRMKDDTIKQKLEAD